jgi:acyl-CoA synthetase (AMP-forming)/AMP-acid ligase II
MAGDFCSEEEVMSLCREVLPQYQLPQRINLFPELEKNGSGKIKRIKGQVNGRQDISENEALEESL